MYLDNTFKLKTQSIPLPKGAWLTVFLLFFVGMLNYLDRTTIATMRSSIIDAIPMTDAKFGMLTTVFLWVYALLSPLSGYIADRFGRSKVIIVSLFVWSLVTWLTSYATTYNQLLLTRALMGISEAFYIPAAGALIIDYHKNSTQSIATSVHTIGITLGSSLGFIGGWLAEKYTWHYAFHIFGVIGIIYAFILAFLLKEAPRDNQNEQEQKKEKKEESLNFGSVVKDLFKRKEFVYLFVFWGILGIVGWTIIAWLPTYYKEQFDLSQSIAGLYATVYLYPVSIVGLLLGGFLSDFLSKTNRYARISVPIIGLSIAAPCVFFAGYTSMLYLVIFLFMGYAFARATVETNFTPILCSIANQRYRSTGLGILNMIATMIGGLGIYITGALRDMNVSLNHIYQIASFSIVICVGLLWLIKKELRKQNK